MKRKPKSANPDTGSEYNNMENTSRGSKDCSWPDKDTDSPGQPELEYRFAANEADSKDIYKGKEYLDSKYMENIQLHFTEKGKGTPLILLHGNEEDSTYFEHQVEALSRNYRVIALDTRGHGKSPRGIAPFTIRQFASDLKNFMDENHIRKADILGFSDGANIAMIFAAEYPAMVHKLILNGGNLNARGVKASVQIPITAGYQVTKIFKNRSIKARRKNEFLSLMVDQPNITKEELSKITAPTLVIAGTRDMIKYDHTLEIARNIPKARVVFVDGDHFVAAKNPVAFNQEVLKFLKTDWH